jgi:hypothetical protein
VPDETTTEPSLRTRLFPSRVAVAIAVLVCIVVPATLVALQINQNPKLSPIDEAAHFDYVQRIEDGTIPRQGEVLQESTLDLISCRGTDLEGILVPRCDAKKKVAQRYPGAGSQYEAQQPPTYYALTVPARWVFENVLQVDNELDATRATGIVWLVLGLLMLWAAGRLMDIGIYPLGAALLLLAVSPLGIYHAATVSNDATAIFAGGLVALVGALTYRRGAGGRWWAVLLVVTGALAVSFKTTNMLPVLIVAALFAVKAIADRVVGESLWTTFKRWWPAGGWLLVGGGIAGITWVLTHRALALIPLSEEPAFGVLRLNFIYRTTVLEQATELFLPLTGAFTSAGTLRQNVQLPFSAVLGFLIIAAALGGLFTSPRRWNHWLGLLWLPIVYVIGAVFGLSIILSYESDPGLSGRYALSAAPLLLLVLAASLVGKWSVRAVGAFSVAMALTTFAVMVT